MAPWFRDLNALLEDLGLIQSGLQPSVCNSSSRDPMPFSGLCEQQACTWCTDIHAGKMSIPIKIKINTSQKLQYSTIKIYKAFTG